MQQAEDDKPKQEIEHVEKVDVGDDLNPAEHHDLLKSRFDEMSIPRTLWVFRRVVLVVLSVYTGYLCEGFEVSNEHD